MAEKNRKYYQSSSFKMAVLFAILLGLSGVILGYFMYAYNNGVKISEAQVAISKDVYNRILWLGGICIFLLSIVAVISFGLSIFVVRRINLISNTAKKIMITGDLSKRIQIDHRWDDLSDLAYTLNEMLSKIESLMADVRQVSDNIAHDLRTPLTRIRNNLESLKQETKNTEMVEKLTNEADGLLQTFNASLRITNIEKGKRHNNFTEVYLNEILTDVIELYEPLAHEKNIEIKVELEKTKYNGDRDLLFQAFANIIDNSVKFTPNNGIISIKLSGNQVTVSDTGIGLFDEEKSKVFERFYRSDKSRYLEGNGLGLSLVKAVVDLHKGKIELADNTPSGLVFMVVLYN
jgi:signal transduction histidine kinase